MKRLVFAIIFLGSFTGFLSAHDNPDSPCSILVGKYHDFISGIHGPQDLAKGKACLQEAVAMDCPEATHLFLLDDYENERWMKDPASFMALLDNALEKYPDYRPLHNLRGLCIKKDHRKEAVDIFRTSAKLNDPDGFENLGFCYAYGLGVAVDYRKALDNLLKAKELYPPGRMNLHSIGYCHMKLGHMDKALEIWKEGASRGESLSFWNYLVSLSGKDGEIDFRKALEAVEKLAGTEIDVCGLPEYHLGLLCNLYSFDMLDDEGYLAHMKKSALQGNLRAQYLVGEAYFYGIGTDIDIKESKKWLSEAASRGSGEAQDLLESSQWNSQDEETDIVDYLEVTEEYPVSDLHVRVAPKADCEIFSDGSLLVTLYVRCDKRRYPKFVVSADAGETWFQDDMGRRYTLETEEESVDLPGLETTTVPSGTGITLNCNYWQKMYLILLPSADSNGNEEPALPSTVTGKIGVRTSANPEAPLRVIPVKNLNVISSYEE